MKSLLIVLSLALFASCVQEITDGPSQSGNDKGNFNWSTLSVSNMTLDTESDILNSDGDTVATNLLPGTYALTTGATARLHAVPSVPTKAGDPSRVISFPSRGSYATLMAEDVFPHKGDYDMNDIVLGFRVDCLFDEQYTVIRNIRITIRPRALGSAIGTLGLAAQFRSDDAILFGAVSNSGPDDLGKLFTADARGVEIGTENVVPLSGDLRSRFETASKSMINTFAHLPFNKAGEFTVDIPLDKGIWSDTFELFGNDPRKTNLDLFVVVGERGKEIHLKGQKPTAKFDRAKYFGSLTDFVTKDHYVWMVLVDKPVAHAQENKSIEEAYPAFSEWVKSNGASSPDWYETPNRELIYTKTE